MMMITKKLSIRVWSQFVIQLNFECVGSTPTTSLLVWACFPHNNCGRWGDNVWDQTFECSLWIYRDNTILPGKAARAFLNVRHTADLVKNVILAAQKYKIPIPAPADRVLRMQPTLFNFVRAKEARHLGWPHLATRIVSRNISWCDSNIQHCRPLLEIRSNAW